MLVGPGLANLQALVRLKECCDATLVSEGPYHGYSGMLPGVAGGAYSPSTSSIDLAALCARHSVNFRPSRATRIDQGTGEVELANGDRIPFDVLSLNLGSGVLGDDLPGIRAHATLIKPLYQASLQLVSSPPPFVVVGSGWGAVELALNLRRRSHSPTTLVCGARLLPRALPRFAAAARQELERAGVELLLNHRAVAAEARQVFLSDGKALAFGTLLWVTGPRPPDLLAKSALSRSDQGYLRVEETLQSESDPRVFGAGDCIALRRFPSLERAGVFAMRQGKVLVENLASALNHQPPKTTYRPRTRPLQLMGLGDGRALGTWRGHVFRGRGAFLLKEWIDRRWIARYQVIAARPSAF